MPELTDDDNKIEVEVVYGVPHKQSLLQLLVDDATSVQAVIEQSGILSQFSEIDLTVHKVGIWNRSAKLTDTVRAYDRIEIYRPLIADPKEVRKLRAEKAKEEGRDNKITGGRVTPL